LDVRERMDPRQRFPGQCSGVILAPLTTGAVGSVAVEWMSPSTIRLLGTFKTDEGFEAELTDWTGEIDPSVNNMTGDPREAS